MKSYLSKLAFILPAFAAVSFGTTAVLMAVRWALAVQFPALELRDETWELWIPLLLSWVPVVVWMRPRFRVLVFKQDADRRRLAYQVITWLMMVAMISISQRLVRTATSHLQHLPSVSGIGSVPAVRYYEVDTFAVQVNERAVYSTLRRSGRHHNVLTLEVYYAVPFQDTTHGAVSRCWYGVRFNKRIDHRRDDAQKGADIAAFKDACEDSIASFDFSALDHFERLPPSKDRDAYYKAIAAVGEDAERSIVLRPVHTSYAARTGNGLAWIFGAFGIGLGVLLFLLIWPGYDDQALMWHAGRNRPAGDDWRDVLHVLVPREGNLATLVIFYLNVLVFVVMVCAGLDLFSPDGIQLLEWGGNRRTETMAGEWWRLLTSTFLHAGIMHLLMNMTGLLIASAFAEPLFGRKNYLVLYTLSGIAASVASIWWHPHTISVGASGAIYGLFGALLGAGLRRGIPLTLRSPELVFAGIFAAVGIAGGWIYGGDTAAHLAGLASGILLGMILHKPGMKG